MNMIKKKINVNLMTQRELKSDIVVRSICEAEGYSPDGFYTMFAQGSQSLVYGIYSKDRKKEFVLKTYTNAQGGFFGIGGRSCIDADGRFDWDLYRMQLANKENALHVELSLNSATDLKDCPFLVNIYQAGCIEFSDSQNIPLAFFYLIMEKCIPLEKLPDEKEVLRMGTQLAQGLHALHSCKELDATASNRGIFHSDIKPNNVLMHIENGKWFYQLTDFGTARLKGTETSDTLVNGVTTQFADPELASGSYAKKADLYSLCATMYHLITSENRKLIPRLGTLGIENGHLTGKVSYRKSMPAPANASVPFQNLLVNGLECDSHKRKCRTAAELKAALQNLQLLHGREAYISNDLLLCRSYMTDVEDSFVEDAEICTKLASLYILLREYKNAEAYLKKAIEAGDNATAYFLLGFMNKKGLRTDGSSITEADRLLKKALRHPGSSKELRQLVKIVMEE